ncbi:MAG TPA: thiamine pyrophosphate-binding protein [Burkholderiales bacterium]|jgi:acetolactate synthase-1/2/3 large subunit
MAKTTGAKYFAQMIHGYGITHVFYVPQIASRAMVELEMLDLPVQRVIVHSEKAAAYMADGYARARGGPALCMSQPIGASNLSSGLRDAYLAGVPVIAVSGGPVSASRYRHAYQEVEDFNQFDAVTKLNMVVDEPGRLPDLLRQAFRAATSGKPGPVHLRFQGRHGDVPLGDLDAELRVEPQFARTPAFRPAPELESVTAALQLLKDAARPVIIAGGGVHTSGGRDELVALAEKLRVPVATTPNGKGLIADAHPLALGIVGTYSRECVNKAVAEADLVFFIGTPAGGLATANWRIPAPGTRVIQLDIDGAELGRNYPNEASIAGDARTALRLLLEHAPESVPSSREQWLNRIDALVAEWRKSAQPLLDSDAKPIRPERICREISEHLPENGVLVSDTGHAGMWTSQMVDLRHPGQRYIRCAGSLGWGLPGAIGIKCALPDQPVLLFTGDGGMHYHLSELETALRHKINVVVLVNNNAAYNQEIASVERNYGGQGKGRQEELYRFGAFNFAEVAKAMGCESISVEEPGGIGPALKQAFKANKPVVIDVTSDIRAFAKTAWVPS